MYLPGGRIDFANPLAMVMVEIGTTAFSRGNLEIHLRPPSDVEVPYIDWWDGTIGDWIGPTDPCVGLITESINVRVIPAPATLATLSVAWRRR